MDAFLSNREQQSDYRRQAETDQKVTAEFEEDVEVPDINSGDIVPEDLKNEVENASDDGDDCLGCPSFVTRTIKVLEIGTTTTTATTATTTSTTAAATTEATTAAATTAKPATATSAAAITATAATTTVKTAASTTTSSDSEDDCLGCSIFVPITTTTTKVNIETPFEENIKTISTATTTTTTTTNTTTASTTASTTAATNLSSDSSIPGSSNSSNLVTQQSIHIWAPIVAVIMTGSIISLIAFGIRYQKRKSKANVEHRRKSTNGSNASYDSEDPYQVPYQEEKYEIPYEEEKYESPYEDAIYDEYIEH